MFWRHKHWTHYLTEFSAFDKLLSKPSSAMLTQFMESTNIYVDMFMINMPAGIPYLNSLRKHLRVNSICAQVMKCITEEFMWWMVDDSYAAL